MTPDTPVSASSSSTPTDVSNPSMSTTESVPQRYKHLTDIYNATGELELEDELLLSGVDEPVTFEQVVKDEAWREAIHTEIAAIEKIKHGNLQIYQRAIKPLT